MEQPQPAKTRKAPTPGSWQAGVSGNPKGRPRKGNALAEIVREDADPREMVATALTVMRTEPSASVKLQALQWLRDSGYQRPADRIEVANGHADDDHDADIIAAASFDDELLERSELHARDAEIVARVRARIALSPSPLPQPIESSSVDAVTGAGCQAQRLSMR